MSVNCKDLIIDRLETSDRPLAVHEFKLIGYSENNVATRLSELAKVGKVGSRYRKPYLYKEWFIIKGDNNEKNN